MNLYKVLFGNCSTHFERLFASKFGGTAPITVTVYGTRDSKMYQLSDGKLYRVRRANNVW